MDVASAHPTALEGSCRFSSPSVELGMGWIKAVLRRARAGEQAVLEAGGMGHPGVLPGLLGFLFQMSLAQSEGITPLPCGCTQGCPPPCWIVLCFCRCRGDAVCTARCELGVPRAAPLSAAALRNFPKTFFFFLSFLKVADFPGKLFCLQPLSPKSFQCIKSTENRMSLSGPSWERLQAGCAFVVLVALFHVVGF